MVSESGIYNQKFIDFGGFDKSSEAVLLHSTSLSRLYRISLHGRHFLFKTPVSDDSFSLAMLRREYEISAGCAHPNIVNVLAFCETSPVGAGILMEYVDVRLISFSQRTLLQHLAARYSVKCFLLWLIYISAE